MKIRVLKYDRRCEAGRVSVLSLTSVTVVGSSTSIHIRSSVDIRVWKFREESRNVELYA